jgi:hypothetical protein
MGSLYRKRKMTQSVESRAWGWTRPIRSSCQLEVSLTPIILATQEAEIRRIWVQSQPPYLEKLFTKIGLMEWLKVKALSSSPSTAKEKRKVGQYLNQGICNVCSAEFWLAVGQWLPLPPISLSFEQECLQGLSCTVLSLYVGHVWMADTLLLMSQVLTLRTVHEEPHLRKCSCTWTWWEGRLLDLTLIPWWEKTLEAFGGEEQRQPVGGM